jgi:hypothetical protein
MTTPTIEQMRRAMEEASADLCARLRAATAKREAENIAAGRPANWRQPFPRLERYAYACAEGGREALAVDQFNSEGDCW